MLGTGTLANGSASFTTSSLTQGTHSITAVYGGDAADSSSTSSVLSQSVKLTSGLTLVSSLNPSVVGQTVTFTVNVNPAATGTVQFLDGSSVLSTVPITWVWPRIRPPASPKGIIPSAWSIAAIRTT